MPLLLALIPLSAKASPSVSSAGGNYLVLEGVDDYAVLNFEAFGILLLKGTLVGKGGAKASIPLAVEAQGKLATTWGELKQ